MFSVVQNGENRLDITFSGKLDSNEMQAALDDLADKAKDIKNGIMLYRIGDFQLPTLGAIGIELSRIPELFRLIGKFDKAAVIAGQNWVRIASQIEGALIPGLEIRAFESDKEPEAEAWLAK